MSNFVPQTEIVLCNHVPFDKIYEVSVYFDTKEEQQAFFNYRKVLEIAKNTYQRMSFDSFKVQAKADDLREQGINYCYWKNGDYSNKYYYAFVTSIEYVNPNTAIIYYELDDYQTYMFDVYYNDSYFYKKHYDLGNRDNEGNLVSFTCPLDDESLDYGNIYKVISRENLVQIPDVSYMVFTSTIQATGQEMFSKMPLVLSYYIVPVYVGRGYYDTFTLNSDKLTKAETILNAFRNNSSMVGTLVSVHIIPFLPVSDISYEYVDNYTINIKSSKLSYSTVGATSYITFIDNQFDYYTFIEKHNTLSIFPKFSEQKLYMKPYSFNLLSTDRGNDLIIQNEYCNDEKISVSMYGTLSTTNKQMFVVDNYNDSNSNNLMDNAIIDESNSSLPIVDDYTASYIQSNRNSIEVARANALATHNANYENATNTYNVASEQWYTTRDNARRTQDTALYNNKVNAVINGVAGAISTLGSIGNNNLNSLSGLGETAAAIANWYANENTINTTFTNTMNQAQMDTYSAWQSARNSYRIVDTDFENTLRTLNGKYQDAKAIADTARNLGNDYVFNVANMHDGIYLYHKTIRDEYVIKLTNYFKMYGYTSNEMGNVKDAMNSREIYNYLKLVQINASGNMPQDKIISIKGILTKGITLFHKLSENENGILTCNYSNLAKEYDDCMYDKETNIPLKDTHNVTLKTIEHCTITSTQISNIKTGDDVTITITADSGYNVKGLYGSRLGVLYEGNIVTLPIYHDETFTPIIEQDV